MNTQPPGNVSSLASSAMVRPTTSASKGTWISHATRSPLPIGISAPTAGKSIEVRNELTRMSASLCTLVAPTSR
jgi:hypothetical protein